VFLESGTTVSALSEIFPTDLNLTVITNNLFAATSLAPHAALTVILIGGRVRPVSLTPVDMLAMENLQRLSFDVAFLGTNGFGTEAGLTAPDMSESAVKGEILKRSGRRILLADHSKHGQRNLFKYADIDEIDLIISDTNLKQEVATEIRALGVEVRLA
jgi:DeoR family fructose operon transcriptional repressor